MALITDLPASTTISSTDLFVKDTGSATQKITGQNTADQLLALGSITTSSNILTATSGSVSSQGLKKYGKVATLYASIVSKNSQTAVGSDAFQGTIASGYRPAYNVSGVSYYGSTAIVTSISTDGTVTGRVTGANLAASANYGLGITYLLG